jgi:hypothetical protein
VVAFSGGIVAMVMVVVMVVETVKLEVEEVL